MEGDKVRLYHLPQRIEGGIKINGLKDKKGEDIDLRFHHIDGMYSYCTVEGSDEVIHLSATTELVYEGNDEYRVEEPENESDKSY